MQFEFAKSLRSGTPPAKPNFRKSGSIGVDDQLDPERTPVLRPPRPRTGVPATPSTVKPKLAGKVIATATKQSHVQDAAPENVQEAEGDDSGELSPKASSIFSDGASFTDDVADSSEDSVQVMVRVRPLSATENAEGANSTCVDILGLNQIRVTLKHRSDRPDRNEFRFDQVLGPSTSQQEIFEVAGLPVVENCMNGYNSSIFAYGQTGAGKTYTMLGHLPSPTEFESEKRGLTPRVFQHLFNKIAAEEDAKGRENVRYTCRCSFLEIYNECITDLLDPTQTNLQIREDTKRGCFVESLTEDSVLNVEEVLHLMKKGADNRHVGETRMNRESSRSHSVLTCTVEKNTKNSNGLTNVIFSRLNLIDLAGSERVKSGALGGAQTEGEHFKETCAINKSLTTLGRVIMELVDSQRAKAAGNQKGFRHIPYRDSRLTFLLQESLGGNAKTMIIANVSPSVLCGAETLSTLQFVQRAKNIKNKAVVNLDCKGDVVMFQKEIQRLNAELENLRKGYTEPAIQENAELRIKVEKSDKDIEDLKLKSELLMTENARHKRDHQRMLDKMAQMQSGYELVAGTTIPQLTQTMELYEQLCSTAANLSLEQHATEVGQLKIELESYQEQLAMESAGHADAISQHEQTLQELHELKENSKQWTSQIEQLQQQLEQERQTRHQNKAQVQALHEQLTAEEHSRRTAETSAMQLQQQVETTQTQLSVAELSCAKSQAELRHLRTELDMVKVAKEAMVSQVNEMCEMLRKEMSDHEATKTELHKTQETAEQVQNSLVSRQNELLEQARSLQQEQDENRKAVRLVLDHEMQNSELKARLAKEQEANADLVEQVMELQSQVAHLQQQLLSQEADHAVICSTTKREVEGLAAQIAQERDEVASVRGQKEELQGRVEQLTQQLEELGTQHAAAIEQSVGVSSELASEREQHAKSVESAALLSAELEQVCMQLKEAGVRIAELEGLHGQVKGELEAKCSEYDSSAEHAAALQASVDELTASLAAQQEAAAAWQERLAAAEVAHQQAAAALESSVEESQAKVLALSEDTALLQAQQQELQHTVAELRGEKAELLACIDEHLAEISVLREQLCHRESSICQLQEAVGSGQQELSSVQAMIGGHMTTIAQLNTQLSQEQEAVAAARAQIAVLEQDSEVWRSKAGELEAALAGLQAQHDRSIQELEEERQALERATTAVADRDSQLQALREEASAASDAHRDQISKMEEDVASVKSRLKDVEAKLKLQLTTSARQMKAISEISKLTAWAKQESQSPKSPRSAVSYRSIQDESSPRRLSLRFGTSPKASPRSGAPPPVVVPPAPAWEEEPCTNSINARTSVDVWTSPATSMLDFDDGQPDLVKSDQ